MCQFPVNGRGFHWIKQMKHTVPFSMRDQVLSVFVTDLFILCPEMVSLINENILFLTGHNHVIQGTPSFGVNLCKPHALDLDYLSV